MAALRLRSVRLKRTPRDSAEAYEAAKIVRGFMVAHGCYLQKHYDAARDCLVWMAHYA